MDARIRLIAALAVLSLAAPGVAPASSAAGNALVLRTPAGGLRVVDGSTGQTLRSLPAGALSADGRTLLTARVHGGSTLVRRISITSGKVVAQRSVPGAWGLQRAAGDGTLVAGGDHGLVVALVAADRANGYRGSARTTRLAVLPSSLRGSLRVLRLHGNFGVDAFAPSGQYLYLIQHLDGEHYKVRAYDLMADRLDPHTVVDKAAPNERMAGLPLARAESAVGNWVLTLYRRPSGVPFVHALMANSLYAFCIDLPASARVAVDDPSTWGIDVQNRTLFVANAATGFVASVDLGSLEVMRTASLGAQPAPRALTRPLAASLDGTRLFLARPQGLVPLDPVTLAAGAPLTTRAFGSLVLGDGGATLYGAGDGTTQAFDARTGAATGTTLPTGRLALVGAVGTG